MPNKLSTPSINVLGSETARGVILQLLYLEAEISRAHLSRVTGFSKQTVSTVMANLEANRLVEAVGSTHGQIGRRAITYQLNPTACFAVGIDLGGTNLRAGLIDFSGRVRAEISISSPQSDLNELIKSVKATLEKFYQESGIPESGISQVVIGVPGVVHPRTGVVSSSPNLPYLNGVALQTIFSDEINQPVLVDNDVNIASLGEREAIEIDDFVFLALGTGVGMALVLDGYLRRGFNGNAGEISDLPLVTEINTSGEFVNFQDLVSGRALESAYLSQTAMQKGVIEIFELAKSGDSAAIKLIDDFIFNLAVGIKAISTIIDPAEIVLGGGIGARADVRKMTNDQLVNLMPNPPTIRTSALGTRAGLVGAMSLALSELRKRTVIGMQPGMTPPS
jgi:predicted NBD/HSP70 family sugar kinase